MIRIQININKIKKLMKQIPLVYSLNALFKAKRNSHKLKVLHEYYQYEANLLNLTYNNDDAIQQVRARLVKRGVYLKPIPLGKLRIFWVGAHYAQDMSGFLQGLKKFGEVLTFKNEEGGYGLLWPQTSERHISVASVVESNSRVLLEQVKKTSQDAPLHLVMGQMWSDVLSVDALVEIQKMGIPTVNISMDDKLPDLWRVEQGKRKGSAGLCGGLDLVLTTSPDTCLWYAVEECPAIYWPLASSSEIFYPREKKIYDVVFVGGKYGLRGKLVREIIAAGVQVEAFGPGWSNGFIGAEKIAEVFGEAKIILGTGNVGYNKDILTIKLRDFDATMSGALYITHRNPDLLKLFEEGKEIECYDSIDECVQKIKYYLAHPNQLRTIAGEGLAKARTQHTWEKRIADTLRLIGLLE